MDFDHLFPSKYLSSDDLQGREVRLVIARIEIEELGRDRDKKPVLYFTKAKKGMVLNKTNAKTIKAAYGSDTDQWEDREVILYSMKVQFGDEIVDGIRLRIPPAAAKPKPELKKPEPKKPEPVAGGDDDPPWDDRVDDIADTF